MTGRLVYLEWWDSNLLGDWTDLATIRRTGDPELSRCCSVGWVVAESPTALTIAGHQSPETAGTRGQVAGLATIPKVAVICEVALGVALAELLDQEDLPDEVPQP